jgi:radical SAM protein with 4Fe4S-binding SPASM domain
LKQVAARPDRLLLQEVLENCSRLSIPAHAVLELTYRCNLKCRHCYIDIPDSGELALAEWKGIIDQLKAAGTIYVLMTGGVILLRPDIMDIAAYVRHNGLIPGFLTNGTLINADIARDMAALKPFSVAVSLYGASPATHDGMTGVAGCFERTVEGIKLLVSHGVPVMVQTIVMKTNLAELSRIKELVEGLGATPSIETGMAPTKSGAEYPFQYEPSAEELIASGWQPKNGTAAVGHGPGFCKAGKGLCSVSPGGDVFPCIMFPLKLGNLKQTKFDVLWRLEPRAELRYLRSMRRTDLHACVKCDLVDFCQRCTGIAYLESGHVDGPSASGCRQAEMRRRLKQSREVTLC